MSKLVFDQTTRKDRPIAEANGEVVYINTGPCCSRCHGKRCHGCCDDCLQACSSEGFQDIEGDDVIPIPNGAEHGFIFGSTGSGKSYFSSQYAQTYRKVYPENVIYLVSYIDEDDVLDKLDIIRIPLGDISLISEKTIHDCLIIFDDVDALPPKNDEYDSKEMFKAVENLRDQLLTRGRHFGISVLVTSHLGANFTHTRVVINESGFVVIFPQGGNFHQIKTILQTYAGFETKQVQEIKNLKSRWVYVHKSFPPYVVHDKGVYTL
jgi:hypothetical protein